MAQQHPGMVSEEQYRYALTNFRIAHEKVEDQRGQLQEQEKQVALLRARIALLEGTNDPALTKPGNSVDDFSIRSSASQLERLINSWAADVVNNPPAPLNIIRQAALADILDDDSPEGGLYPPAATPIHAMSLLRHAVSQTISEGVINCLIVTDSAEANIQLTRIHEHIFSRDATVAAVWRRQTFGAAVESCSPAMAHFFLGEHMRALVQVLGPEEDPNSLIRRAYPILEAAYEFSRMLHGAPSSSGGTPDAFYRAFVQDLGTTLLASQVELVKRCMKTERGEQDRVGATVFPGLVKVTRGGQAANGNAHGSAHTQTVVRRAQVICECALGVSTQPQA